MDINQARFLFEIQRVGERVSAECRYTPDRPRMSARPTGSVRHALALWLHRLAARLDVPELQPV